MYAASYVKVSGGCWKGGWEAMLGNGGPRKKLSQKFTLGEPVVLIHRHAVLNSWYPRR